MRRIGIVAGVQAELDALLPDAPGETLRCPGLEVRKVTHQGRELFLACAGIGKVAATTAATLLHAHVGAELLMVIGTAGKLSNRAGRAFCIESAVQSDYGAMRDAGFEHYAAGTLPIGPARLMPFAAHPVAGHGLPVARIASADMFVESPLHAARLRDTLGADLVDMETAAVAQAAALLGLPWLAVKAATDGADDDSAGAFAANLAAAAHAAAEGALQLLARL